VRECKGKRGVLKVGGGVTWSHRISEFLPAAMANTGEKFCRPGGFSSSGKGGETERRGRAFIGRSRGGIWCLNLLGINSGQHSLAAEVTAALMVGGGRRPRADEGVPPVSEKEGRESTLSGIWPGGLWAACGAGPNSLPAAFFLFSPFSFSFPFLVFPISFILFAI
jgi:hypothetical protein